METKEIGQLRKICDSWLDPTYNKTAWIKDISGSAGKFSKWNKCH